MKSILSPVLFCLFAATAAGQAKPVPQLGKNSIKQVIAAMTLEEKAKLVVGMGFKMPAMPTPAAKKKDTGNVSIVIDGFKLPPSDPDADKFPERVPGAAGRTHPIPRLGIPSITVSDGPAGVRIDPVRNGDPSKTYYATAWPTGTLIASSWDTSLAKKVGTAFGNEVKEYGIDILLGPALNIHRNPLGGRNFEYFSEDPLIAGQITAALVNGVESNGVGTSIKHFTANNQETNRNSVNTIVSERAMREIYLKGFEIAVKKAQPWTVMSSYNLLNGTYTSERPDLITGILRNEWDFKGFVMTDWFGGKDPVAQMKAGNDLLMPGNPNQSKAIIEAVKSGNLDEKQLDKNVEKILTVILLSPTFKGYKYSTKPDLAAHAKISRQAAAEGMVMLKNNASTLPLKKGAHVALFGNTSYDLIAGGTGSGDVNKAYTVSLEQGLSYGGIFVDPGLKNTYSEYIIDSKAKRPKPKYFFEPVPPIAEMTITPVAAKELAASTDVALITLGRNAGEGADRKIENDFTLSSTEKELLTTIANAFHEKGKKLIVVLNIGGVIEMASWRDIPDAILLAWQPGLEGGNAITDVLSGKINPSGKLATTFPVQYQDVPSASNFPGKELNPSTGNQGSSMLTGRPSEVTYEEGIFVGYRYYNTFKVKPAYEFGYGLSYTNFSYKNLKIAGSPSKGSITVSLTVTNTGKVAGKEIVQLYLGAPAGPIGKPEEELKAFTKTPLLAPGQSQQIRFTISPADLASFNTQKAAWIADAGNYWVLVGASSEDIRLKSNFTLDKEITVTQLTNRIQPQVQITELKK